MNARQFVLPPPGRARVARAYAQAALDEAVGLGLALPGGAGVAGESLPVADYLALLQAGQALRPDFGLRVGARMRTAHFVAYGQVLLSCATFGDALRQTQRFEALAHDLGRSELQVQGELAEYRWLSPWAAGCAALPLSVLAGIQAFGSWMAQRPLAVHGIDLPFAMPAQPEWSERLQQQLARRCASAPRTPPRALMPPCSPSRFPAATRRSCRCCSSTPRPCWRSAGGRKPGAGPPAGQPMRWPPRWSTGCRRCWRRARRASTPWRWA
ncbi:AraC family transcriptional regulator ligand-binding domain-containing protein [Pseudorhodoferax sp.]|uniref:AraC family transcriptional regulator ligand-binding domain-containing protein n=1 Tax=Pseudorhodoferax sp. TaxID=1993553 RepID=UPI002DD688A5|nr:AraC family transcriptional regulator ligand-binding domain-containing protein [Pseudorhodoferax sp.]